MTFPALGDQLPRTVLHGLASVELNFIGAGASGQTLDIDYSIEGLRYTDFDLSEVQGVNLQIDPRLLAAWKDDSWQVPAGRYEFALG